MTDFYQKWSCFGLCKTWSILYGSWIHFLGSNAIWDLKNSHDRLCLVFPKGACDYISGPLEFYQFPWYLCKHLILSKLTRQSRWFLTVLKNPIFLQLFWDLPTIPPLKNYLIAQTIINKIKQLLMVVNNIYCRYNLK